MKTKPAKVLAACLLLTAGRAIAAYNNPCGVTSGGLDITMCQVMGSRDSIPDPRFPQFEDAGVSRRTQRDIFIGLDSAPAAADVRRVAVFISGQEPMNHPGVDNAITGQVHDFRDRVTAATRASDQHCAEEQLFDGSLFMKVRPLFDPTETFIAAVYGSQWNYLEDAREKERLVEAYVQWIVQQSDAPPELVYLAGSSRGGCLCLVLAKRLATLPGYQNTRFVIHTIDPVCNYAAQEADTRRETQPSPLNPQYRAHRSDLRSYFIDPQAAPADRERLLKNIDIFSLITGAPAPADLGIGSLQARAMINDAPTASERVGSEGSAHGLHTRSWYQVSWRDMRHAEIGRSTCETTALQQTLESHLRASEVFAGCSDQAHWDAAIGDCMDRGHAGHAGSAATETTPFEQPASSP